MEAVILLSLLVYIFEIYKLALKLIVPYVALIVNKAGILTYDLICCYNLDYSLYNVFTHTQNIHIV